MSTPDAVPPEVVEAALHAATRAPSVHNTQPWRFVVAPSWIELHLDRERMLPVADPDGREALLSCGAALLNLTLALRAGDHRVATDLLPDATRRDHLATVRIGGYRMPAPEIRSLATAIDHRATNRRPFYERPVPAPLRRALARAAEREGSRLVMLDTPRALDTFAGLLRRADHLQEQDPAYLEELHVWTTGGSRRTDGVPRSAGGPRPIGGELLKLRRFHHGVVTPERPFEQEPLVAVLTSAGDTVRDLLRAGQAMQRVLLNATSTGLGASFLSQPIEIPYIRAAVRTLVGGRHHPQTVLRFGYGHPPAPTPRRPVSAVATFVTSREVGAG